MGVKVSKSSATFYLFPNFELCRKKLSEKGVKDGQGFCDVLFDEEKVAVSNFVPILVIREILII